MGVVVEDGVGGGAIEHYCPRETRDFDANHFAIVTPLLMCQHSAPPRARAACDGARALHGRAPKAGQQAPQNAAAPVPVRACFGVLPLAAAALTGGGAP